MNNHKLIMVIIKLIETTANSLKLLRIGELTPIVVSTLTPVSKEAGSCASREVFRKSGYFICSF
jgi:hypothetical protein